MPYTYGRLLARAKRHQGFTRREMIGLTAAGTAGLLLSNRVSGQTRPGRRVLIVGAGFAGLAAAYELNAAGYDVRVFDARNRTGGRVLSFHDLSAGHTVEGGGELIGSNHPTWEAYRRKFGLEFLQIEDDPGAAPIVLDGRRLREAEADSLFEELDAAMGPLTSLAAAVDAERPWTSPDAESLDRRATSSWIDVQSLSARARRLLHREFSANNGVDTAWQSLLGNLAQIKGGGLDRYWTDSETCRCRDGNQQLADRLTAALPAGRLHLRATVRSISTIDRGASLTLADGTVVEGDDVILAVPPSVWHKISISPPLPALLRPQMGSNVKFLMVVRSKFWRRAGLAADLTTDGPVSLTWEATNHQPGSEAVLTAFSGAAAAEECRGWRPAERANQYLRAIEVAYREIAREFVKARFMDWPGDAWTQGSYSFPAPGQVTKVAPVLYEGIGRLHFAGEHANPAFVGYMEGALGSGVATAKRLAARDGVGRQAELALRLP